jgi:hypothetical protein
VQQPCGGVAAAGAVAAAAAANASWQMYQVVMREVLQNSPHKLGMLCVCILNVATTTICCCCCCRFLH